jgi:hypothetical protein
MEADRFRADRESASIGRFPFLIKYLPKKLP